MSNQNPKKKIINILQLKWAEARDLCEWRGMRLPTLKSLQTLRKVAQELSKRGWGIKKNKISWMCLKMYSLPGNLRFWLAATDVGWTPGWFVWTDGIQVDNSPWFTGDPQQPDSFGVGKEACVFLYAKHAALGDGSCSDTHYIFCEVPQESIDCIL